MARSRRSLQRTGNVTSIAEARQKREAKRQAGKTSSQITQERAASAKSVAAKAANAAKAAKAPKAVETAQAAAPKKKVSNRTYNKEKVEALKAAIAAGTYQINARRTADKFIERESPA